MNQVAIPNTNSSDSSNSKSYLKFISVCNDGLETEAGLFRDRRVTLGKPGDFNGP